jgi:Ca-activated chloride channel family protein
VPKRSPTPAAPRAPSTWTETLPGAAPARRARLALAAGLLAAGLLAAPAPFAGRTLVEALRELQAAGLQIIYSSDLVRPEMRVAAEPAGRSPREILDHLLAPHGLRVQPGPGGSLLILAAPSEARARPQPQGPPEITLVSPPPDAPALQSVVVEAEVTAEEPVESVTFLVDEQPVGEVRDPPYRLTVDLGEDPRDHRFTAQVLTASGATAAASVTTPRLVVSEEVSVELRQLYVAVTRRGERALELESGDFVVVDDGRERRPVTFARGDVPFTAALLIDASDSMRGERLASARVGARAFLEGLGDLDEARLMAFSDRLLVDTPPGGDRILLGRALDVLEGRGGTAVFDHLYLALKLLEERQGRPAVVLVSDGNDVVSALSMRDVLWKVRDSSAILYWVRLGGRGIDFSSAWRDWRGSQRERQALELAVRESGGAILPAGTPAATERAFREILRDLRSQYVIGYYPGAAHRDGRWRAVQVRVRRPGYDVRVRRGYID